MLFDDRVNVSIAPSTGTDRGVFILRVLHLKRLEKLCDFSLFYERVKNNLKVAIMMYGLNQEDQRVFKEISALENLQTLTRFVMPKFMPQSSR